MISGDLNYDFLHPSYETEDICEFAQSLAFHIVPPGATFYTHSDSLLDVVITDDNEKVRSFFKSSTTFIAGHDLLRFEYAYDASQILKRTIYRRNYDNVISSDFHASNMRQINSSPIASSSICENEPALNDNVSLITNGILSALDKHAPLRKFRSSPPTSLSLDNEMKLLM